MSDDEGQDGDDSNLDDGRWHTTSSCTAGLHHALHAVLLLVGGVFFEEGLRGFCVDVELSSLARCCSSSCKAAPLAHEADK